MIDSQDYSLKLAEKHVSEYSNQDSFNERHREAMECRNCEDFLELGINAFKWLTQADETIRQAAIEGLEVSENIPEVIATLYRAWLRPCDRAEALIKEQRERGFRLKNLNEFRDACDFVRQQVRLMDMENTLNKAQQDDLFDVEFWQEAALKHVN